MHNNRPFFEHVGKLVRNNSPFFERINTSISSPVCAAYRGGPRSGERLNTHIPSPPLCAQHIGEVSVRTEGLNTHNTQGVTHTTRTSTGVLAHNNSFLRRASAQNDSLHAQPYHYFRVLKYVCKKHPKILF